MDLKKSRFYPLVSLHLLYPCIWATAFNHCGVHSVPVLSGGEHREPAVYFLFLLSGGILASSAFDFRKKISRLHLNNPGEDVKATKLEKTLEIYFPTIIKAKNLHRNCINIKTNNPTITLFQIICQLPSHLLDITIIIIIEYNNHSCSKKLKLNVILIFTQWRWHKVRGDVWKGTKAFRWKSEWTCLASSVETMISNIKAPLNLQIGVDG